MSSSLSSLSSSSSAATSCLSDRQEKVISILPIPAALLSILGSVSIIYIAVRTRRNASSRSRSSRTSTSTIKWTPYTRLLIAISSCDIIYSLTMSLSGFLLPRDTSPRVWAIGTEATCTALGFFSQFFVSVLCYNGMLSFYFLLSARLGYKNDEIARKFEPWMHLISLGYPLAAGFVGIYLDVFHENELGQGCWVNLPDDEEATILFGWIFGGAATVISFISIVVNNLIILVYVRRQTVMKRKQQHEKPVLPTPLEGKDKNDGSFVPVVTSEARTAATAAASAGASTTTTTTTRCMSSLLGGGGSSSMLFTVKDVEQQTPPPHVGSVSTESSEKDEDFPSSHQQEQESSSSQLEQPGDSDSARLQRDQLKRLKLVASQAFLYVAAFGIATIWTALLQGIQSMSDSSEIDAKELEAKLYPILVLQSLLLPMQGIFNFFVYVRPKFLKYESQKPDLSRAVILRQIVFGSSGSDPSSLDQGRRKGQQQANNRNMIRRRVVHMHENKNARKKQQQEENVAASHPRNDTNSTTNPMVSHPQHQQQVNDEDLPGGDVARRLPPTSSLNTTSLNSTARDRKWREGTVGASIDSPIVQTCRRGPSNVALSSVAAWTTDLNESIIPPPEEQNNVATNRWGSGSAAHSSPPNGEDDSTPLPPIAQRLPSFQISSVTASIGDFDESTAENNKWEETGSLEHDGVPLQRMAVTQRRRRGQEECDESVENKRWTDERSAEDTPPLPPIVQRLSCAPDDDADDESPSSSHDEEDDATYSTMMRDDLEATGGGTGNKKTDREVEGGSFLEKIPFEESTYYGNDQVRTYCFPRVSSLEMISELSTPSILEMENEVVSIHWDDISRFSRTDDIGIPTPTARSSSSSPRSSSSSSSKVSHDLRSWSQPIDLLHQEEYSSRWSTGSKDCVASGAGRVADRMVDDKMMMDTSGMSPHRRHDKFDRISGDATRASGGSSIGMVPDAPISVPTRRQSPPPSPRRWHESSQ